MEKHFEVSFNSPQCGWMSVGFESGDAKFNTTTAYAPYSTALQDLLTIITEMVGTQSKYGKTLNWNRDPEEYAFVFGSLGDQGNIESLEFPTKDHSEGETVFEYQGDKLEIAKAFATTFQQMYEERDIDEFEENWHQKFPVKEFDDLKEAIREHGQ